MYCLHSFDLDHHRLSDCTTCGTQGIVSSGVLLETAKEVVSRRSNLTRVWHDSTLTQRTYTDPAAIAWEAFQIRMAAQIQQEVLVSTSDC